MTLVSESGARQLADARRLRVGLPGEEKVRAWAWEPRDLLDHVVDALVVSVERRGAEQDLPVDREPQARSQRLALVSPDGAELRRDREAERQHALARRVGAASEDDLERGRRQLLHVVEVLEVIGRHRPVAEHEAVAPTGCATKLGEREPGVPLAEVHDVRVASQQLGLEGQRERDLLDEEAAKVERAAERSGHRGVTRDRPDRAFAVRRRPASLDQVKLEPRVVAQGVEALARERLEPAPRVIESRADEQDTRWCAWSHPVLYGSRRRAHAGETGDFDAAAQAARKSGARR